MTQTNTNIVVVQRQVGQPLDLDSIDPLHNRPEFMKALYDLDKAILNDETLPQVAKKSVEERIHGTVIVTYEFAEKSFCWCEQRYHSKVDALLVAKAIVTCSVGVSETYGGLRVIIYVSDIFTPTNNPTAPPITTASIVVEETGKGEEEDEGEKRGKKRPKTGNV